MRKLQFVMLTTIRSRLLMMMMAVLLPGVAAALFVAARTYQSERDSVLRGLHDSALAMAQVVDRELARRVDIAHALSSTLLLVRKPDDDPNLQFFHAQLGRIAESLGGWIELHSASHELLNTRQPKGTPPRPHEPGFALFTEPTVISLDFRSAEDWRPARVVQPVLGPDGVLLNLVITIPPEVLQRAIDHQGLPANWVGTVVDSGQLVVARHPGGAAYVGRQVTADMREQLANNKQGPFSSVTLDGNHVQGYFSKTTQGWAYMTAAPREHLIGDTPVAVVQMITGALLLLAVAGAGAAWVGRGIAEAAESLTRTARAIQAGESELLEQSIGITEFDEVSNQLSVAARALASSRHDLERRVAEAVARTREVEQRAAHGQRIAALGQLTGGVAHDFNNLLGVISNSAHLIERHVAQIPELQMPVAVTQRAVQMGSHLAQQLLRFGGRQSVNPVLVDLAGFLPGLSGLLKTALRDKISVTIQVEPGVASVMIDRSELELTVINIALNARDAMPDGGQLLIQARNATPDETEDLPAGRYVLVALTDSGVGLEEHRAARVFEPFYTTKAVGQGSGLGLSQVHGFCVQAGGTARMASTPGLGTTVSLLFPACAPQPQTALQRPALALQEPVQDGEVSLAGVHILLVEDSDELGEVTDKLLQSHGCRVRRARDVSDALAQVAADDSLQLVLSDVVMPGARDGVDLAHELARSKPHLPVVLISGYSAALNGLTGFTVLRKPVAAEKLVGALVAALRGDAPAGGAASA